MMNKEELPETRALSVKATANLFSERVRETQPHLKKPPQSYSEKPSSRTRESNLTRNEIGRFKESRGIGESMKAEAESELLDAKNTVNDLSMRIEQSNSRAKAQMDYLEKLKKTRRGEGDWGRRSKTYQSEEVMKELEVVKQELSKLKLEMALLLEAKKRAEKETEVSSLKARSYSTSVEVLKKEIEEINEEHVLVELARIEAMKEYEAVESQRKNDAKEHSAAMDESRRRIDDMNKEVDASKELATKLDITTSDVNMLQSELKQVEEMGNTIEGEESVREIGSVCRDGEEPNDQDLLHSITKEIESGKKELAALREESFKFMASMDIIRTELKNVSSETARAKRRQEKADLTIQNLNAKLLRGKAKLEAASLAEEKARSIVGNLSRTLEQLKTEAETAKTERALINEETASIKAEIDKTESEIELAEERLQVAIEELKSVKSSEAKALQDLQKLIENAMRSRASASQRGSKITISKFEYEYLKGRAAAAEEIADKKVAASQAWIEALRASEKEILIKTEMAKKENRETRIEEERQANRTEQSVPAKKRVMGESESWWQNYEKKMAPERKQLSAAPSTKSTYRNGKTAPSRRGKPRKSASPAVRGTPRSTSFAVRRKTKVMPNLAKFFSGKSSKENM